MALQAVLKIADEAPFFKKVLDLSSASDERFHSLASIVPMPDPIMHDGIADHFLRAYSAQNDVVLDPFAGSSDVALNALMLGRVVYASDACPLRASICSAKLYPADIAEVTLALQMLDLRRPVELGAYLQYFAPFYDIGTFRELVNLRRYVKERPNDRVAGFIKAISLGLLHGQGAGFFSVYTSPQISLSPTEQLVLNAKRSQEPDYRAVVPRIIRKAAMAMRDGQTSLMRKASEDSSILVSDPRNLLNLNANSIDLILTNLPLPYPHLYTTELWLKSWFAGTPSKQEEPEYDDVTSWLEYMNELLLEFARVTRGGKRAVLNLQEVRIPGTKETLDELLLNMVSSQLKRYWETEGMYDVLQKQPALKNCLKPRENTKANRKDVVLVLRRK